jgi:hypothetical protein
MKWFKRIAQGFSPGLGKPLTRPERASEAGLPMIRYLASPEMSGGPANLWLRSVNGITHDPHRSPFQGVLVAEVFPGLKPWAVLYNRFAVSRAAFALRSRSNNKMVNHEQ